MLERFAAARFIQMQRVRMINPFRFPTLFSQWRIGSAGDTWREHLLTKFSFTALKKAYHR